MKAKISLLFVSILLFSLSFPNILFSQGFFLFGWLCYIPLFLLLDEISVKKSFFWGLVYGFATYSLLCFWLYRYDFVCGLFTCIYMAVLFGLLFLVLVWLKDRLIFKVLAFVLFDLIRTAGFLGNNYGLIGYSQFQIPFMLQLNVYLAGCVIYLFAAFAAYVIKNKKVAEKRYYSVPVFIMLLIVAGCWNCFLGDHSYSRSIKVALVQHNSDPWAQGISSFEKEAEELMRLTEEVLSKDDCVELVIWPETSVVPDIIYHSGLIPSDSYEERKVNLVNNVVDFIKSKNCAFVVGNNYHERENLEIQYNSVLFFPENFENPAEDAKIYNKNHLVPFSEYFPFAKIMPHLYNKLIRGGFDFYNPGKGIKIFEFNNVKFSTPVCFEDTFYQIPFNMKKSGSELLVNLSNDSWSGSESCQNQHVAMACFRSAENKIPSVRSTCSGVTCVIDDKGKIISELPPFSQGVLIYEVPLR